MKRKLFDDSLWFVHKDGTHFYPWFRQSGHHRRSSFWVSDGSNRIEDAIPVAAMDELVLEVFSRGRSVWLIDNSGRTGLYRFGHDAIRDWGASEEFRLIAIRAGAPASGEAGIHQLPALVGKALADTGYDLVTKAEAGWLAAGVSGTSANVLIRAGPEGVLLALPEPGMAGRIGLAGVEEAPPPSMASIGSASDAALLYEALRLLHSLQSHPAAILSARLEARLAAIPETERTREVRQRIGQDIFREALMDLWQGRCAVTGLPLPDALLRASHAKPWAKATGAERLDPFNGLLLAIHLDAMFDSGLIAFAGDGRLLCSPHLDVSTRSHFGLDEGTRLRTQAPGHAPYLSWHRKFVFRGK